MAKKHFTVLGENNKILTEHCLGLTTRGLKRTTQR
jgi:hypothetical protein